MEEGSPPRMLVGMSVGATTLENNGGFLKLSRITIPSPVIPLLGTYPAKMLSQKYTCTPVFIAQLSVNNQSDGVP